MDIALWRKSRQAVLPQNPTGNRYGDSANAGLLLRRGLERWPDKQTGDSKAGNEKAALIADVAKLFVPEGYSWAYERWKAATKNDGTRFDSTELDLLGRLYIGLSRDSALETGITVQHAWGMPMIPGSALKGMSRHMALTASTLQSEPDAIAYLFGSEDEAKPECGAVVFHDAWWVPQPGAMPFAAEVVTPHHTAYYNLGSAYATDFDSPIPAAQIAAQGRFRFVVEGDSGWCTLALALLKLALTRHGVGGKTTSGYGLFAPPPKTPYVPEAAT